MAVSPVLQLISDKSIKRHWQLGLESERFVWTPTGRAQYTQDIEPVLIELADLQGWKVHFHADGHPLGLNKNKHAISLEPGAQFEIAVRPSDSLFEIQNFEKEIEAEVLSCPSAHQWQWMWQATDPENQVRDIELIPSARYQYMTDYFPAHGKRGLEMMRLTTGFHLNVDYFEVYEALELMRAAYFITPSLVGLFANSPFIKGQAFRVFSERAMIWQDTDSLRSGVVPGLFDYDFGIGDYVNYVESQPLMYFMDEQGVAHAAKGQALRDLSSRLQEKNATVALRQVFTEARLKPCCVEVRCFDQVEPELRYAALALAVGCIYCPKNRDDLAYRSFRWSEQDFLKMQKLAAKESLNSDMIYQQSKELLKLAETGLVSRGRGEENLLVQVEQILKERKSPAMKLIEHGAKPQVQKG